MTHTQNLTTPSSASPDLSAGSLAKQPCLKEGPNAPAAPDSLSTLLAKANPAAHALAPLPPNPSATGDLSAEAAAKAEPLPALQFINPALDVLQKPPRSKPRNGKIARLPRPQRDMVNRMLSNNMSHQKIVDALGEFGFQVTHQNVSNWKNRGGYKEWCVAQARALELRNFQDNLTDFLRRHDAAELSEVGLQSAATSLSAVLLRPDLIRQLLAAPEKYAKLIELQCRLARELHALQKDRDAVSNLVGGNPERLKRQEEKEVERIRECYSYAISPESARDPGVQHHNFIPKEIEPVHSLKYAPGQNLIAQALSALRGGGSSTTPPQTAH